MERTRPSADLPVVIAPGDPAWPGQFARERVRLAAALHPLAVRIEHVGSTSVPGLAAKPILDILLGAPDLADFEPFIPALEASGWRYHPEHEALLPNRRFLARGPERPPAAHLHAVALGDAFWESHLRFRDLLRADAALASDYEALKRELARRHRHDREAYTRAKTDFIAAALRRG